MSKDEALRDLIERVEQAEGPDRELDFEIARAVGHVPLNTVFKDNGAWNGGLGYTVRRYSESLDAAMTLVPEGWTRDIRDADNGDCLVLLEREGPDRQEYSRAKTWSLAIVAASLRAHMGTGG